jgi:hypothetical protein
MSSSRYNTRIDESVIITMLIISVAAVMFMAFRHKNYKPCSGFDFSISANEFKTGQIIFLNAKSTLYAEKWSWDFGDKSPADHKSGPIASHIYKEPGQYLITLTINGKCADYKTVIIKSSTPQKVSALAPQVVWPADPVEVGQKVLFSDITNGAQSWEWYIGEGKESQRFITKDVLFTFSKAGNIPVQLIINNDFSNKQQRIISVTDAFDKQKSSIASNQRGPVYKPRINKPIYDTPTNPALNQQNDHTSDKQEEKVALPDFENMFRGVISGNVNTSGFSPYLCRGSNVPVSYNGDPVSFDECIKRLREIKKIKWLKSLKANVATYQGTSCIMSINLVVKEKTIKIF